MKKLIVCIGVLALVNTLAFGGAAITDGADDYIAQYLPNTASYIAAHDMFGIADRSVPNLPYDMMDDSISIYVGDSQGIINETDLAPFFGVCDTVNGIGNDTEVATWVFDISGLSGIGVQIDFAAMGDFETSNDLLSFTAKIDNGTEQTIFENSVNESGDLTYTLAGGSSFTVNDPMSMNGVTLNNIFKTLLAPVSGSGSTLTLKFSGQLDGSYEAFAFRNIIVDSFDFPDPNSYVTYSYGWEDGYADVLTTSGNVYEVANEIDPNGFSQSLRLTEFPVSGTPGAGIAWVKGLEDGDKITASFKAYDVTHDSAPSVKIAGTWADSTDITSNYGYAETGSAYSGEEPNSWSTLTQTWTYSDQGDGSDALMVQVLLYSVSDDLNAQSFWIDDVEVTVPDHCSVVFPYDMYSETDYQQSSYTWDNFPSSPQETNVFLDTFGILNAELEIFDSHNMDGRAAVIYTKKNTPHNLPTLTQALNRGYEVALDTTLTPEGCIAVVTDLAPNDYVKASVFAKTLSEQSVNSGVRLWAYYIDADGNYAGTAGGCEAYSTEEWSKLAKRWVFSGKPYTDVTGTVRTPVGIAFSARVYGENDEGALLDDIAIEAPNTATVSFPAPEKAAICVNGLPEYDLNQDCKVDLADLAKIAAGWLSCNLQSDSSCN